jgi:hypothetical protein
VGLEAVGGLSEISARVLGTATTWVASTGSRAAGGEAQTPRLVEACERQVRGFLGGALRCLASSESPSPARGAAKAYKGTIRWPLSYYGVALTPPQDWDYIKKGEWQTPAARHAATTNTRVSHHKQASEEKSAAPPQKKSLQKSIVS